MRFPMRWKSAAMAGVLLLGHGLARAQGTLADYQRGQALAQKSRGGVVDVPGAANWIGETDHFWYTRSVRGGTEFVLVDAGAATKRPAFDHEKLAAAISAAGGKPCTGLTLPFAPQAGGRGGAGGRGAGGGAPTTTPLTFIDVERSIRFGRAGSLWARAPGGGPSRRGRAGRGRRRAPHQPADFYRWGAQHPLRQRRFLVDLLLDGLYLHQRRRHSPGCRGAWRPRRRAGGRCGRPTGQPRNGGRRPGGRAGVPRAATGRRRYGRRLRPGAKRLCAARSNPGAGSGPRRPRRRDHGGRTGSRRVTGGRPGVRLFRRQVGCARRELQRIPAARGFHRAAHRAESGWLRRQLLHAPLYRVVAGFQETGGQRLDDAAHGPARKRLIPDQFRGERLAGDDARQHPHSRAGIAATKRRVGRPQLRTETVNHHRSLVVAFDVAPQSADASKSAGAIGPGGEILKPRPPSGYSGQHGVAVRNGLVAGDAHTSQNVARGMYGDRSGVV